MPETGNPEVLEVLRKILAATENTTQHVEGNETTIAVLTERLSQVTTIATRLHRLLYEGNGSSLVSTVNDLKQSVSHLSNNLEELKTQLKKLDEDKKIATRQAIFAGLAAIVSIISAIIGVVGRR